VVLVTGYRKEREGKRKFSKNFQKTLARLKKVVLPFENAHVIMLIETKNKKNTFLDILN
jgi:hypothetical protein